MVEALGPRTNPSRALNAGVCSVEEGVRTTRHCPQIACRMQRSHRAPGCVDWMPRRLIAVINIPQRLGLSRAIQVQQSHQQAPPWSSISPLFCPLTPCIPYSTCHIASNCFQDVHSNLSFPLSGCCCCCCPAALRRIWVFSRILPPHQHFRISLLLLSYTYRSAICDFVIVLTD
jgi:hypothetical protein